MSANLAARFCNLAALAGLSSSTKSKDLKYKGGPHDKIKLYLLGKLHTCTDGLKNGSKKSESLRINANTLGLN